MRLLLDSITIGGILFTPGIMTERVRSLLADPIHEIWVSAISPYELEWKKRIGKLAYPDIADWDATLRICGYQIAPINSKVAVAAAHLPRHHRDPWDRFLIAQALLSDMTIVTNDREFSAYGVSVVW